MAIIMTLWIGNGAVLISFSQWQSKEFCKIIHGLNYLIFKILLIAIDKMQNMITAVKFSFSTKGT